jgi:capsid portal protein
MWLVVLRAKNAVLVISTINMDAKRASNALLVLIQISRDKPAALDAILACTTLLPGKANPVHASLATLENGKIQLDQRRAKLVLQEKQRRRRHPTPLPSVSRIATTLMVS